MIFREFAEYHYNLDPQFIRVENHDLLFEKYIKDNLDSDSSIVLVAEYRSEVIGYCLGMLKQKPPVYPDPEYGYIDNMGILEKYQRMGAGELLFAEAVRWFKSKSIKQIELFTSIKNDKSMNFWKKMGFIPYVQHMYLKIK